MAVGTRDRGVRSENKGAKQVSPRGGGLFRPRETLADGEESLRRGVERVVEIFDVFVLLSAAKVYWMRSLVPMLKKFDFSAK